MRSFKPAVTAVALAASFIVGWESMESRPYLDAVNVPTVCAGHTSSVDMTKIYTDKECWHLLDKDTLVAAKAVDRLVRVPINENEKIAYISLVFNIGEGAFAKSTLLRLLNSGQYTAACQQLPRWVYAEGKKLRGLVRRRNAEMMVCLTPVNEPLPKGPFA
jgi:lysozyme